MKNADIAMMMKTLISKAPVNLTNDVSMGIVTYEVG